MKLPLKKWFVFLWQKNVNFIDIKTCYYVKQDLNVDRPAQNSMCYLLSNDKLTKISRVLLILRMLLRFKISSIIILTVRLGTIINNKYRCFFVYYSVYTIDIISVINTLKNSEPSLFTEMRMLFAPCIVNNLALFQTHFYALHSFATNKNISELNKIQSTTKYS